MEILNLICSLLQILGFVLIVVSLRISNNLAIHTIICVSGLAAVVKLFACDKMCALNFVAALAGLGIFVIYTFKSLKLARIL